MKSVKYYENFSGWKYKWLTCLKGPAGHGTESRTVSTSMWRIMNWGLWLLKCGWVYVRAHFSAWRICNLVWVPRVVCLAVFTEFVGHPLRSRGLVEQNELLATGNRLYLSRQSHVQPLCSLISLTVSFKATAYFFKYWSYRGYWIQKLMGT